MPLTHHNKNPLFVKTLIGAHTSIQGGLENALYEGKILSCTCIQMFTHSNRQWSIKPLTEDDKKRFQQARDETGISEIAVHASYLINLASTDPKIAHLSRITIQKELERCEFLNIPYLIIHPGSALKDPVALGLERIAQALTKIFEEVPHHSTKILLENMAGQGSVVGSRLEELAAIASNIPTSFHHRLGFCIDLCHAFAAGYSFATSETYEHFWNHCNQVLGLNNIHAIHMNDSLKDAGSKVDRHAHIGKGKIGVEAFRLIMNDPQFISTLKILETPIDEHGNFATNMKILRSLMQELA